MVPQRVNEYKGHGQAAPSSGTSTALGETAEGLEAGAFDEIEAVVVVSDDDAVAAKSVSIQFYTKATSDGADFTSWTAVGDPVVTALGTGAQVRSVATARKHTRDFGAKFAAFEATITHSDASLNTVEAAAFAAGISKRVA